ncbi:hypothetical protein KSP40_PGU008194 [Platanthera guangdongensis]|uniref:PWWP domain-containing protein n=1 Tax=Platanthera guangdongensis TaxID=2320717 RepID=A0ABR2MRK1_9ASPA
MISVMEDFEIVRKSAESVAAAADLSFLGAEKPREGVVVSDGCFGGVSSERVFSVVDSAETMPDLVVRVSGEGAKLETDADDVLSPAGESRDSFDESSGLMHGYRVGDMVWGKVKSHPWWPGHIFNEAFASPSVRRMRGDGLVLVAFFGDSSYGWFDPAELIPFEPNFPEKSRQTSSRNFVRAVEEAVDEASRRVALAVACCCRNRHNFRPSTVPGYFHVDVVGYEPGGLYSSTQINEARDNFVPLELLSFVNQLALGPRANNGNTIEWIQTAAKLVAYRRSVFEEFDETYAQAFGVEPMRPSYNSVGGLDQIGRFAPRVAPLSGPLVVAEVLGVRRSSTRLASHKPGKNSKKNKYVLKRREDLPPAVSSALPGVPSSSQPPHHAFLPSLPDSGGEPPISRLESNYFFQKRETPPPPFSSMSADLSSECKPGAEVFLPPDYSPKPEPVEIKRDRESSMVFDVPVESSEEHDGVDAVMEKVLKRTREDLDFTGEEKKKKKKRKKKKDLLGADHHASSGYADHRRIVAGRSLGAAHGQISDVVPQEDGINMDLPPGLDLNSLSLTRLVNDLSSIALDPFYGDEEDAPAIVRHVFLRFRSLVYQKSLVLGSGEQAAPSQTSAGRDGRTPREPSSSFQKKSFGEVTKTVRKRDPSDRQDELSVKKMKKMNQLKQLVSKKRDAMSQNNPNLQQQTKDQKETAMAVVEATRKPELPPAAPKLPSPTFLLMKFPPRSILPSATNLKARFARFGPLDPSATRVYWKSYTCKVLFKYKSDAQSAYDFVKNNQLFGQAKVYYNLRDLEISGQDQLPESRPSDKDAGQYRHGNAGVQIPSSSSQLRQNQMQLKSILKKPGGDDSYNPNNAATTTVAAAAASSGAIVRESPRVKFMLKDDEDLRGEPPVKVANSNTNGGGGQVPFLPSIDQISRQAPKSIPFPPPPSAPPLQLLQPHRIPLPPPPAMPPPLPPAAQLSKPRVTPPGVLMQRALAPAGVVTEGSHADISGPMLSLLLKCNDIVGRVKSSLGYTPYHML